MEDDKEIGQVQEDTSIRGAIRAAIDEVQEDGSADRSDAEVSRADDAEREVPKAKTAEHADDADSTKKSPDEKPRDQSGRFQKGQDKQVSPDEKSDVKGDDKQVSKPETTDEATNKPPFSWTKEGKAAWNSLPPDVQKSVLKREEEFSNGIRMYSEKAKAFDELDQVIAPYKQQIANFGVTPAQTVGKLFEWMNALGHPNQEYKAQAFKVLAESFGLNFHDMVPGRVTADEDSYQQAGFDPSAIAQLVDQKLAPVQQTLTQYQQREEQQARERAASEMAEWSKNKPYFEQVRVSMHNLITSGEVPLTADGRLDLDTAYEKAVWLNAETRQAMQQSEQERLAAEALEKANREATQRRQSLMKAKSAGVGIKPSAPSMRANMNGVPRQQPGNAKGTSIRDSISLAMQQLREGE